MFVFFSARYLKTAAARLTKLNKEMFDSESWKSIYFRVKRSKVKVTRHKKCRCVFLHSCECWLLLVDYANVFDHYMWITVLSYSSWNLLASQNSLYIGRVSASKSATIVYDTTLSGVRKFWPIFNVLSPTESEVHS